MQWYVRHTGKPDVYTITAGGFPPPPGAPGFRRDTEKDKENGPHDVVNAPLPGEWYIVPVEGSDDVFRSAPSQQAQSLIQLTNFKEFAPSTLLLG